MRRDQDDRLRILLRWILAGMVVLWLRAFQLTVLCHETEKERAQKHQSDLITIPSLRGPILDRAGEPLAFSVEGSSLAVDPKFLGSADSLIEALRTRGIVAQSQIPDLLTRIRAGKRFVWITRGKLREADADTLERRFSPALIRIPEPKRLYPLGSAAGPLLGATGFDGKGLLGLEARYERSLHGIDGRMLDFLSGSKERHLGPGRVLVMLPQVGATAELTIDARFQQIADARLREAVIEQNAKGGTAIVLDPRSGELLAISSFPSLDPDSVGQADSTSWKIWGIGENYEPGSTYKLVAFAAALEAGVLTPDDPVNCHGGKRKIPGGVVSDHEPHGTIPARLVLAYSSNVGTGEVAEDVGAEGYYRMERLLGFGVPSGVEIPGEERGLIPDPSAWSNRSLVTQAFGQEISCTALQLAMAYATVANDGVLMRPFVVRSVRTQDGQVLQARKPEILRRAMRKETAETLRGMLRGVVTEGTGKKAEVQGLFPAGKTGTAQKYIRGEGTYSNDRYIASFVGFAPFDSPRWLCIVVLDEPRSSIWGGSVAAPVFARILEDVARLDARVTEDPRSGSRWLAEKGDPPVRVPRVEGLSTGLARKLLKDADLVPEIVGRGERVLEVRPKAGTPCKPGDQVTLIVEERPDSAVASALPDLVGLSLRDAIIRTRWLGLSVDVRGSGWVVTQIPASGTPLERTGRLTLWLSSDSCSAYAATRRHLAEKL